MANPSTKRAGKKAEARRIVLGGQVQGVGFRPYIYRQARDYRLQGWVRNLSGRVEIHVQGDTPELDRFVESLMSQAPSLSRPVLESVDTAERIATDSFSIRSSRVDGDADVHVPADLFTCDECLRELNDTRDRRYRYPFINCTQCGPRYSLIRTLPYDRGNTSMAAFDLCKPCHDEYTEPSDRRYHAEPVACDSCGPRLTYTEADATDIVGNEPALEAARAALARGKILAIKGVGGYHLVCDARDDTAIERLRRNKPRPDKPLAVMFPAPAADPLAMLRGYLDPDEVEARLLLSPARPIVLVRRRGIDRLADAIAPGLVEVGAMLAYSPLHHLLLNDYAAPLVATSANVSGEPVLTDNDEVELRLGRVAEACLHHDRPIVRPADDPVFRVIDGRPRPIRLGRGISPVEIELPFTLDATVLAVGAQMKNTVTLAWGRRAVISPHIGDMDSARSLQTFERCVADLQTLYQVEAERILCDAHYGYSTTRWAQRQELPRQPIYHHHAHASAVWFEARQAHPEVDRMLVFTWDGVGLGADGSLWGGEALQGRPGNWRRAATWRSFRLPGGERAGREPWRSAAALCWEAGLECSLGRASDPLLQAFWHDGKNAPVTSAVGRLFDAASALCGLGSQASYEGQGPMRLEAMAARCRRRDEISPPTPALTQSDGLYVADWEPLLALLTNARLSVETRAAAFHEALAQSLLAQACAIRADSGCELVGFAGGVFQNRLLTQRAVALLRHNNFGVSLPATLPVNDAGISFGQVVEYGCARAQPGPD